MSSAIAIFKYLPRTLRVTREGKSFVLLILAVGFAAFNTGNNLLYLLAAALLSLVVISGLLSEASLRRTTLEAHRPAHFVRGERSAVRIVLHNRKTFFPSFSLGVTGLLADERSDSFPFFEEARFIKISPGEKSSRSLQVTFPRRGRYLLEGFRLSTPFPFGFFVKALAWKDPAELWVYPKVRPVSWDDLSRAAQEASAATSRIGQGAAFSQFRNYSFGDDCRMIHWKLSARQGRWILKEREREEGEGWNLVLSDIAPAARTPAWEGRFERAVETVASLAAALSEAGLKVSLRTANRQVAPGSGRGHLDLLLRTLALLEPADPERNGRSRPGPAFSAFYPGAAILVRTEEDRSWTGKESLFQAVIVVDGEDPPGRDEPLPFRPKNKEAGNVVD